MKYLLVTFLLYSFYTPLNISISKQLQHRDKLLKKYSWLDKKLYYLYRARSLEYGAPIELGICVVQAESNGRTIISRKNKNGTRDYGKFQINSVHMPDNPRALLGDIINSRYGFWYLSLALNKTDLPDAIRLYNQGLNGKRKYYKNWKYVRKILKCYSSDIIKNKQ